MQEVSPSELPARQVHLLLDRVQPRGEGFEFFYEDEGLRTRFRVVAVVGAPTIQSVGVESLGPQVAAGIPSKAVRSLSKPGLLKGAEEIILALNSGHSDLTNDRVYIRQAGACGDRLVLFQLPPGVGRLYVQAAGFTSWSAIRPSRSPGRDPNRREELATASRRFVQLFRGDRAEALALLGRGAPSWHRDPDAWARDTIRECQRQGYLDWIDSSPVETPKTALVLDGVYQRPWGLEINESSAGPPAESRANSST
jgi:hypothetical protein